MLSGPARFAFSVAISPKTDTLVEFSKIRPWEQKISGVWAHGVQRERFRNVRVYVWRVCVDLCHDWSPFGCGEVVWGRRGGSAG